MLALLLVSPGAKQCARHAGLDFLAFYAGGTIVREGRTDDLYRLEKIATVEQRIASKNDLALGEAIGPFWNPPFYALPFVALSALPFRVSLLLWTCINLFAVAGAVCLLIRMLPHDLAHWRHRALVAVLLLSSAPFMQFLTHGQNTGTSLLLLTLAVAAWRAEKRVLAGIAVGLLAYKPQLAAVVAGVMILDLGRRAAIGAIATVVALLFANLIFLPGTLETYLHRLPINLQLIQIESAYLWERHATLKAFWRLLVQGRNPGETSHAALILTAVCWYALAAGLGFVAFRAVKTLRNRSLSPSPFTRDRLIAATIASMPLLMPFYFDYDLLLLTIPLTLLAAEWMQSPRLNACASSAWILRITVGLFVWTWLNPYLAASMQFNATVSLLFALAALLVHRVHFAAEARTTQREDHGIAAFSPASAPSAPLR